ncbi:hypothetical protein [Polyangium aurulentum]|uniref:hypothetical protein n=1 Tax=Polyangium aurulentum TaxID=2567896 RepID=UPI0010ADDCC2|nr:hypothetical protein [Polyangium aurulentum]UQA60718.1 hypothetical protein E8A73_009655 [Polyangium aurulentum]
MTTKKTIALSALAAFAIGGAVSAVGCSGGDTTPGGTQVAQGGAGGAGGSGTGANGNGGDFNFIDAGANDGALNPDSACAAQSSEASLVKKPVDIIIFIDNSASMGNEIVGVQNNINVNFAQIIEQSGLDYRVIMVAKHGKADPDESVCIEAPLSGIPQGGCAAPPAKPVNNPPKFYHYSIEVTSHDSWCKLLSTFKTPDLDGLAPNGWSEWLRPDSFKTFIELTDDGVSCSYGGVTYSDANTVAGGKSVAEKFDNALLQLAPEHFGTADARNYKWYSIVAMSYNEPADKPYEPADPVITGECPTAADPGTGYQALSVLTGALRFPLCDTTSYDTVFKAIADGVISGAQVNCNFAVPEAPMGSTIDLASVVVEYTPGGMGAPAQYKQVADAAACAPDSFFIDKATKTISLCPDTCALVQKDTGAKINVLFACDEGGAN